MQETRLQCVYYQEHYDIYGSCPPGYVESRKGGICYQKMNIYPWTDHCLTTGASSLSFLDLSTDEQFSILEELQSHSSRSNVGLPAKNTLGSGEIDNTTEDVELQWLVISNI